ncbi:hypothetical protein HJC23_008891 [Cyclotella cryptica]|uniref:Uncharacterized protein n=1 Tax=Cyclotella cryptica TaxID=29204 RepID=A0ABD3NPF0_9STRA
MTKLAAYVAVLSITATSAFHVPQNNPPPLQKLSTAATTAAIAIASSPLIALAEQDDDYVYGAVAAPGGLGLAAGLGVLAILTAAVPVVLAPGEDAFNEMKDRDKGKWGKS